MTTTPSSSIVRRSGTPGSPTASADGSENQPTLDGNILTILFPVPNGFRCPIQDCHEKYAGVNWTSRRQSLMRHLVDEHGLKVTAAYTCTICSATDLGYRPTVHPCISRGRHELSSNASFAHKCTDCPLSSPSRKGLDNHKRAHSKQAAKQRATQQTDNATSTPSVTPAATGSRNTATSQNNVAASSPNTGPSTPDLTISLLSSPIDGAASPPRADPTPPELALTLLSSPLDGASNNAANATATAGATPPAASVGASPSREITVVSCDSQDYDTGQAAPGPTERETSPECSTSPHCSTALTSTPSTGSTPSDRQLTLPPPSRHRARHSQPRCRGRCNTTSSRRGTTTTRGVTERISFLKDCAQLQRNAAGTQEDHPLSSTPRSIT